MNILSTMGWHGHEMPPAQNHGLEKAMAPHSSTLAWKTPWTEEPCGLQSMGSKRVGHDWATSLSLSVSYLSLCLSLNSFCPEAVSPETRCVISIKRQWVGIPIWVVWFHCHLKFPASNCFVLLATQNTRMDKLCLQSLWSSQSPAWS